MSHKKQHYVPACYLKAWRDPACGPNDSWLWLFDKDGSNARKKGPSAIFTERDLYTIQEPGGRDLTIEHGLAQIEDRFARIRNSKLSRQRDLTADERVWLSMFVASAQFRTVSSRDHQAKQWGHIAKIGEDMERNMKAAPPGKRIGPTAPPSSPNESFTLEQVQRLASTPLQIMMEPMLSATTPLLAQMKIAVLCTDDPVGFITSDSPCHWIDPEAYKYPPFYRSPGLAVRTIEVTMPVSPQQCLLLTWEGPTGYIPADETMLNRVNWMQRGLCHKEYIVRKEFKHEYWFHDEPVPEDSWELLQARKQQEGERD